MTEHELNLKRYVDEMTRLVRSISHNEWLYHSVECIVEAIGRFDIVQPLPKGIRRGKMGLCFQNAFRMMDKGFVYVEGIAVSEAVPLPIHHAWCVDESNRVIDTTWRDGVAYWGVHLNKKFVYQRTLRRGKYGVFGDRDSFDLYQNGLPAGAIHNGCT